MKASIYTLGCKVNTYESEYIISLLKKNNYEIVPFGNEADVVIINTCSVTNNSDSKSRKMINQAVRNNKDACIVAMGCFIEANKAVQIDGVDILLGNKDKSKIIELIDEYFKNKNRIKRLYSSLGEVFENMEISTFDGKTRAFVKIQDGCENFCTYCIIPYVRGKCRSKDPELVIKEITNLVNNGYKEIVLTGIHTGNYGVDLGINFSYILKRILAIPNLNRIRISSIEITELSDEVLDIIKNNDIIIADHLHIPLQAGSNHVLKLMNRKYDLDYYRDKIKKIRSIRPNISISTDIIVGFPEESDEDFLSTIAFAREMEFSKIHVFPYSIRKGTPASRLKQVDSIIKKERARDLILLSKELENNYMNKFIGKDVEVLIENNDGIYSYGHTSNYLHIKVKGIYNSEDIIKVIVKENDYPYLIGE